MGSVSAPTELLSSCAKCWCLAENWMREKQREKREKQNCQMWADFNKLPYCCLGPINICHDQFPPRHQSVCFEPRFLFHLQYGSYFISGTNCLHLQPCLFQSHRIVIGKSQRNRRLAPKQLRSSNYKTLGKCWADALYQYTPPSPSSPSNWESHLVSF